MRLKSGYTLQRTMIIYFLLIGFASLLVGVEFIVETNSDALRGSWIARIETLAGKQIDSAQALQPLDQLRKKAVLMIIIIMSVMVIVLTMFIKNITEPLQHMIEKSREISDGDLSQTIRLDAHNELAELGGVINEMSSNLQEIIHLSQNTCATGRESLAIVDDILVREGVAPQVLNVVQARLGNLDADLAGLKSVIDCFKFYAIEKPPHD